MKKLIFPILAFFLFVNINCKKEDLIDKTGTWELRQSGGGLSGIITTYTAGNGSLFKLTKDTYQIIAGNKLVKSGTYKIVKEISILSNQEGNRIIFDNETNTIRTFISFENNLLNLSMDAFDGANSTYEKIGAK